MPEARRTRRTGRRPRPRTAPRPCKVRRRRGGRGRSCRWPWSWATCPSGGRRRRPAAATIGDAQLRAGLARHRRPAPRRGSRSTPSTRRSRARPRHWPRPPTAASTWARRRASCSRCAVLPAAAQRGRSACTPAARSACKEKKSGHVVLRRSTRRASPSSSASGQGRARRSARTLSPPRPTSTSSSRAAPASSPRPSVGTTVVGTFELQSGSSDRPAAALPTHDARSSAPRTSDSGPDSGDNNNCRWPISAPSWTGSPTTASSSTPSPSRRSSGRSRSRAAPTARSQPAGPGADPERLDPRARRRTPSPAATTGNAARAPTATPRR